MNAVVLGNGRSGKSAAELLRREGATVKVLDGDDAWPVDASFDLCVASPGIALDHPWLVAARAAGVKIVSELQLGAERWLARGGRMLAVTGSKGKSSVVKLVAEALLLAEAEAVPCGNYGLPLSQVVLDCPAPERAWAVVEVSSFQMETTDLPGNAFAAAAILNLQEDHLDRHGSAAVYHGLKRRLLEMAKVRVDASSASEDSPRVPGTRAADVGLLAGSYFDNPVLCSNGLCAVALLRAAGLDDTAIAAGFRAFQPLPHRMQLVAERGGVRWVDDSKATSLAALAAGVGMCAGPVRLIAGGLPKGDDPKSVIPRLRSRVKKVYLIGRCAQQFSDAWCQTVQCELCGTIDRAVESARRDACSGETVLLSPGTASFDQFKSYGARGDMFATLAREGALRVDGDTSKRG
ncbi:MAG: UDP-N-acetylmuramoyl-L-alanine--D-glutamate ligase [bacterium]|nr:UDP-N-acetylmuramoyl-L-alanine--D-glutamate ligase [bacterium]